MAKKMLFVVSGASRGLGREICVQLSQRHPECTIVGIARSEDGLQETRGALQGGATLVPLALDLAAPHLVQQALLDTLAPLRSEGRPVFFSNAGSLGPIGAASSMSDAEGLQRTYAINVTSAILLAAAFCRAFESRCAVVNISSLAAIQPFAFWGVYCSHKAARDLWHATLAAEDKEVRVLSYSPGLLYTEMNRTMPDDATSAFVRSVGEAGNATPVPATVGCLLDLLQEDTYESGAHIDCYTVRPDLSWQAIAAAKAAGE